MDDKWVVFGNSVELWSWKIDLWWIDDEVFSQAVESVVLSTQQNFLGFLSCDNWVKIYTRTKYPREKYWIYKDKEYKDSTRLLGERLWKTLIEETRWNVATRFRTILGLREWYERDNQIHSIQEVKSILWEELIYTPWWIYSVILNKGIPLLYTEPVVIINSQNIDIERLVYWAEKLHQQRFTIEDFENRKAFTIETILPSSR